MEPHDDQATLQGFSQGRPHGSKNTTSFTRHRLLMYALASGKTQKEAAELVNMTPQAVSLICRTDTFKLELEKLMDEIRQGFTEQMSDPMKVLLHNGVTAANTMVSLLSSSKDEVRRASAADILDRVMGKAVQREMILTGEIQPAPAFDPKDPESVRAAHEALFGKKGSANGTPQEG